MTILAETDEYLIEFEDGLLTIARRSDGHCKATDLRGASGMFRNDLKAYGSDRTIRTWINGLLYHVPWTPLYKPHSIQRAQASAFA